MKIVLAIALTASLATAAWAETKYEPNWDSLDSRETPAWYEDAKFGIDPEVVNPLGGAIALGHPLGATGAILTVTCAHALRRHDKRYGLVTMCIGGGQGISLVLEKM